MSCVQLEDALMLALLDIFVLLGEEGLGYFDSGWGEEGLKVFPV